MKRGMHSKSRTVRFSSEEHSGRNRIRLIRHDRRHHQAAMIANVNAVGQNAGVDRIIRREEAFKPVGRSHAGVSQKDGQKNRDRQRVQAFRLSGLID